MGIKPRVGGEGGGYVVNVQVLGPTTVLGWVGAAFVLLVPGSSTKLNRHLGTQKLKYRPFPIKIHVFFIGNGRFCLYLSVLA